jgi:hypothetical protein
MVELNTRIVTFIVFFDIFIFALSLTMVPSISGMFTNTRDYNWSAGQYVNYTAVVNGTDFGSDDIQETGEFSIWAFIKFLFTGGMSVASENIPAWVSIPLAILYVMMNFILVAAIISWARELIGFT